MAAEHDVNSTQDKPATPLIPVLLSAEQRDYAPLAVAPIEGGMLRVIDESGAPESTATMSPPPPSRSAPGHVQASVVDDAVTAPIASAKPVATAEAVPAQAAKPSNPKSAAATEPQSRAPRGRFARVAGATSTAVNLAAFGGITLAAFGYADLPPSVQDALAQQRPSLHAAAAGAAGLPALATTPADPAPVSAAGVVPGSPRSSPQRQSTASLPTAPPPPPPSAAPIPAPPSNAAAEPTAITPAAAPMPTVLPGQQPRAPSAGLPQPASNTAPPTERIAKPSLLAAEMAHVARFDALIAPVRDAQPSLEDATRLRDAMASISNLQQTRALRDQLTEPAARKLVDWALSRGGNGSAREIKAFLEANPNWPSRDLITQRSEEQLFVGGGSAREIKSFFDKGAPKTAIGHAALASAFLAEGDEAQATRLASTAWRRSDMPGSLEAGFLQRFGKLLREDDHKARFDRYMIDNTRWSADRAERAAVARRVLPFLGEVERKKADARLAVYLRQATGDAQMAALAADAASSTKPDWGLAFQLAQWHRRAGRFDAAFKILREAPTDAAVAGNLDEWWEERRLAAYDALKGGKPAMAYELVKSVGHLSVNQAKDQSFLAGWIALRHVNDPKAAEQHFAALEAVADGPLSRAKAGYWLARTFEAQKAPQKMRAPLERAATNIDTFYGQLARLELDPKQVAIAITPPRTPTPDETQRFNANELVRAAVLSRKSNLEQSVTRALLIKLSQTLESEAEQGLLAHLAEALGDPQMAVRIGKSAVARGHNLIMYAYPINAMPAYPALRTPPEPALILGITRQESEFDTTIVSGAGARGLMQVMTVTAQHVCRDYRVKCEIERLGRDPAYNAMMASAYIADRMDEFQGSYVLTISGYNAGPGRTRQWIREFGDPRTPNADPLDWIHRIPFEETREYVQKVLSNMQIYRARLGNETDPLRLTADLRRIAIAPPKRPGASLPPVAAPPVTAPVENN